MASSAVVMNRRWDVLEANTAATRFFAHLLGAARAESEGNLLRAMFDPRGLRPYVVDWEPVAAAPPKASR